MASYKELEKLAQELHDYMYDLRRKWFGYLMKEGPENLTFKELKTKGISEFTYSFVINGNRYNRKEFEQLEFDALVTKVELIENDKTLLVEVGCTSNKNFLEDEEPIKANI